MNLKLLKKIITILALGIVAASSAAIAADGKPYSNEWIEGRVQGALAYNTFLDSTDVTVGMENGVAKLVGTVPSEVERELAERIAMNVDGVKTVQNMIKVDPDLAPRGRSESLQRISDATTTAAVRTRLLSNKNMHNMNIQISTKDGIVSLNGAVSSLAQKESAEQIALNTRDVLDVRNDLKIDDANTIAERANNASVNVAREVSDAWISSKIRTTLLLSSDFPGSNVSVNTSKGKVTLNGYARNTAQRAAIEGSVNDFLGVTAVQNNLTIKKTS